MPATDDEIREKYLERAIRELNTLTRDAAGLPRPARAATCMPVLGSGHPQADVFLLKLAPRPQRGRGGRRLLRPQSGTALMKSLKRLRDRPARRVRHAAAPSARSATRRSPTPRCVARVVEELAIVQPQDRRRHGRGRARARSTTSTSRSPGRCRPRRGEVQQPARPSIDALVTPEHRRRARRGGRQARLLDGVPGAGRVVRGPAAVLMRLPTLLTAGLAYMLAAPALPVLHPDELAALIACAIGIGVVVAIVAGLVAASDLRFALGLALLGAALIAAGLNAAGVAARPRRSRRSPTAARAWPSRSSSTRPRSPSRCRCSSPGPTCSRSPAAATPRASGWRPPAGPTRWASSCPCGAAAAWPPGGSPSPRSCSSPPTRPTRGAPACASGRPDRDGPRAASRGRVGDRL